MGNLNLKVFLLCSFSWISASVSGSPTVEVQSGEDVTLLCSNFSTSPTQIFWFRVERAECRCIGFLFRHLEPDSFCDGFQNGRFEMRTNISTLFLKIERADVSDSGLYFCGFYISKNPIIVEATFLDVQEVFDGITRLSVILGGLIIVLAMVITCQAVKIKKLQKAHVEEQNPRRTEDSDDLNYVAVTFRPKTKRNHRPASEREGEPNAILSATR